MKDYLLKRSLSIFLLAGLIAFFSCSKSSNSAPNSVSSFNWSYDGINYVANIDTAFRYSLSVSPIIIAGTGTTLFSVGIGPRISLTSFNVGTYPFGTATNSISYIDDLGYIAQDIAGSLQITANSNNYLSGNFTVTMVNYLNLNKTLTGTFTNVPIRD